VGPPVRVLFTGSRHLNINRPDHRMPIYLTLRHIETAHPGPHTLVHGDADGADQIAAQAAGFLGWATEPHPADWTGPCRDTCRPGHRETRRDGVEYCPTAGNYRNARMVALGADVCVAAPLPGSRGTWDCVRRAKAAGIPVTVVNLSGAAGRPVAGPVRAAHPNG
jgi:hypothetical protein